MRVSAHLAAFLPPAGRLAAFLLPTGTGLALGIALVLGLPQGGPLTVKAGQAAGVTAAATPPVPLRPAVPLAAHRALYQLALDTSRGGRQIAAAHGTMGYEVTDTCDGWASRQRLRMTISSGEGQDTEMESDYVTWESKGGTSFRFHMVQRTDSTITSQTDGSARLTRAGGPGEVQYRVPKDKKVSLPGGTVFPMAHTAAILAAAREGRKFTGLPLFDGTGEDGYEDSSVAILDWKPPFQTKHPMLTPLANTRVRLAFFDHAGGAATPTYEVGMRYWENGVADDMAMDFGDFVMKATLTELSPIPRRC